MTMQELFNNVESAISQYEQAISQEEMIYQGISDAQSEMSYYSSVASSAEDASQQKAALQQMKSAALRLQQYQNQLQQVQNAKDQALRYLQATRAELVNVINSIENKLPKIDQSISTFQQMAGLSFGGSSASNQLGQLQAKRAEYQQYLNDAYSLTDRIDSALNGSGSQPRKVLRR